MVTSLAGVSVRVGGNARVQFGVAVRALEALGSRLTLRNLKKTRGVSVSRTPTAHLARGLRNQRGKMRQEECLFRRRKVRNYRFVTQ